MIDWVGCKLTKCPYGKEYGNCDTCVNLIRAEENNIDKLNRSEDYVGTSTELQKVADKLNEVIDMVNKLNNKLKER